MILHEVEGIKIECYSGDHPPPHVHAKYGESEDRIVIETGEIMNNGDLPSKKRNLAVQYVSGNRRLLAVIFNLMNPNLNRNANR